MRIFRVFAKISGRLRFSHRIFGPTDCEVSALPQRSSRTSLADRLRQLLDLLRRAAVDAVEHGVHQRLAGRVDRQHAGPDGAAARRPGCRTARRRCRRAAFAMMKVKSSHQSSRGRCSAQPGCGTIILCGFGGARDDLAVAVDQHALRFEGADVDAEIVLHWMKSSRSRLKFWSMRGSAAIKKPRQRLEIAEVADLERGMRVAAAGSRDRSPRRPAPTSCT